MLTYLKLSCFRKHEDRTFTFSSGLVVFRGANEQGKSSCGEAIGYALFGARALRQPLAECVTWGKAESELRVELQFNVDNVAYTVVRKKSGAELNYAGGKVVGQNEVTKFCETLLGTTADTASKMMMASQGALRGALAGGPAEAAALIENLADFNLIDRLIEMVQHDLPTGPTKDVESQLATLAAQLEGLQVEELDTTEMEAEIDALNLRMGVAYEEQKLKSAELSALKVAEARMAIGNAAAGLRDIERVGQLIRVIEPETKRLVVPASHTAEQIQALRNQQAQLKEHAAITKAHRELHALAMPEMVWAGSRASLTEQVKTLQAVTRDLATRRSQLYTYRATTVAGLIKEQTCAFCDKDLANVPEVVQRNIAVNAELAGIDLDIVACETAQAGNAAELEELLALDGAASAYERAVAPYSAYITTADDQVPHSWEWIGGEPLEAGDQPDYTAMIRSAEASLAAYTQAKASQDANVRQHAALVAQLAALQAAQQGLETLAEQAKVQLTAGDALQTAVAVLTDTISKAKVQLDAARVQVEHKQQMYAQQVQQRSMLEVQITTVRTRLEAMNFHNALIKKLRGARPAISDKLWTIVLASVSSYFSTIRGVQSVITRSDNSFKADGQAVAGLSGSTLDALGLAIRIALTKTFLPNARFMMLDEVAAACDDEREVNMLGVLATAGFDQILLVTHSDLADAFASQVISL